MAGPSTSSGGSDIKQKAGLGGYIGAQVDLANNTKFNIEYQNTSEVWAIAGGVKLSKTISDGT